MIIRKIYVVWISRSKMSAMPSCILLQCPSLQVKQATAVRTGQLPHFDTSEAVLRAPVLVVALPENVGGFSFSLRLG